MQSRGETGPCSVPDPCCALTATASGIQALCMIDEVEGALLRAGRLFFVRVCLWYRHCLLTRVEIASYKQTWTKNSCGPKITYTATIDGRLRQRVLYDTTACSTKDCCLRYHSTLLKPAETSPHLTSSCHVPKITLLGKYSFQHLSDSQPLSHH